MIFPLSGDRSSLAVAAQYRTNHVKGPGIMPGPFTKNVSNSDSDDDDETIGNGDDDGDIQPPPESGFQKEPRDRAPRAEPFKLHDFLFARSPKCTSIILSRPDQLTEVRLAVEMMMVVVMAVMVLGFRRAQSAKKDCQTEY
ncbi:MAG: hypothetical protein ACRYFU_20050 [Janthinobacterium lividum]